MIKRLGLKRFLRIFWAVFRTTYYPKSAELNSDPRSKEVLDCDYRTGRCFILALMLGSVFTFEPPILILTHTINVSDNPLYVIVSIACGLFLLAIPIATAISMMINMERHSEEILQTLANLPPPAPYDDRLS